MVAHPETGVPWWVPHDLEPAVPKAQQDVESKDIITPRPTSTMGGPSVWVLSLRDLLAQFEQPKAVYKHGARKMTAMLMAVNHYEQEARRTVWRPDMDVYLLGLMRQRVVEAIVYLAHLVKQHERDYLIRLETWEEAASYHQRGCLLWVEERTHTSGKETARPPRLSITAIEGAKFGARLVVYNLTDILDDERLASLRDQVPLLRDGPGAGGSLFLLRGKRTLNLQLLLWRIEGFLTPTG
jgi:hypothetical protein